jgi:hypothetical protein
VTTKEKHRPGNHAIRPPAGFHFIYVLGSGDGGEVRIGKTRELRKRHLDHENANGRVEPVELLAVLIGHHADEEQLLDHFARRELKSRDRSNSWFWAKEIRPWVAWLLKQPWVARTYDEAKTLTGDDFRPARKYVPTAQRQAHQLRLTLGDGVWGDVREPDPEDDQADYVTPPEVIEAARDAMASIDLDPASSREANDVVRATVYYNPGEDGLAQPWRGNVWLHPPDGAWHEWIPKILAELDAGRVPQLCLLARAEAFTSRAFAPLVARLDALLVPDGRINSIGPSGSTAKYGSLIGYVGHRTDEFVEAFAGFGTVLVTPRGRGSATVVGSTRR